MGRCAPFRLPSHHSNELFNSYNRFLKSKLSKLPDVQRRREIGNIVFLSQCRKYSGGRMWDDDISALLDWSIIYCIMPQTSLYLFSSRDDACNSLSRSHWTPEPSRWPPFVSLLPSKHWLLGTPRFSFHLKKIGAIAEFELPVLISFQKFGRATVFEIGTEMTLNAYWWMMGWEAEESHSAERRWRVGPKTGGGTWREEETESNVEMESDAGDEVEFRMGGHITPKTVRESTGNRDYGRKYWLPFMTYLSLWLSRICKDKICTCKNLSNL